MAFELDVDPRLCVWCLHVVMTIEAMAIESHARYSVCFVYEGDVRFACLQQAHVICGKQLLVASLMSQTRVACWLIIWYVHACAFMLMNW